MLRTVLFILVVIVVAIWLIRKFFPNKGIILNESWTDAVQDYPPFRGILRAHERFVKFVTNNGHMHAHIDLISQANELVSRAVELVIERRALLSLAEDAGVISAKAQQAIIQQAKSTETEIRQVETCITSAHEQLLLAKVDHREPATMDVKAKIKERTESLAALAAACRRTAADQK